MGRRKFTLRANNRITPCPKCRNNTRFTARSEQVAEDCCEVWVVCACGYDPTAGDTGHRLEDVWGSLDTATIVGALDASWNYPLGLAKQQGGRTDA